MLLSWIGKSESLRDLQRNLNLNLKYQTVLILLFVLGVTGCVVVPSEDIFYKAACEISSDRKILRVMDIAKETNTYYSIGGLIATPILIPTTAMLSGIYVVTNNIYNAGEEKIVCGA